jgi:predicted NodU family carbamoyl transferase
MRRGGPGMTIPAPGPRISILSFKPGHDGCIAYLRDGELVFSVEAEKDSAHRYTVISPLTLTEAFSQVEEIPDVVAISGWVKGAYTDEPPLEAGYFGLDAMTERRLRFLGREVTLFSSSHERSHLLCAYGLSPFEQGRPCYALVWEGELGDFYEIDGSLGITSLGHVMDGPGDKYAFLFELAHPSPGRVSNLSYAGKLMALAAFSERGEMNDEEQRLTDHILQRYTQRDMKKRHLLWTRYHDLGVEHADFKNLAGKFSDALFDRFYRFAKENLIKGLPLLISGGCGLNCEWNTKWKNSGLFRDVFVPPVANDSGSAIGTAVDAQLRFTGNAKVAWSVYSGSEFVCDAEVPASYLRMPLRDDEIARFLARGKVIAWVQGRYEMGPRALGNRSILAAPFSPEMHRRLNAIKQREAYRPIAPVCREEDVPDLFFWEGPSAHMLFFQKVRCPALQAVTHVDNTARVQTVSARQNQRLHALLTAFKALTGNGTLCNTSLNFNGRGFINRLSDLLAYVESRGLDGFVVGDAFYVPQPVRGAR